MRRRDTLRTSMRTFKSFGPLLVLTLLFTAFQVAYVVARTTISEAAMNIIGFSLPYYLMAWVVLDARARHRVPCHDFGFLVYLFLPVALPWYVFWTRGWRGFLTLGFLVALFSTPPICARVVYELLR